MEVRPPNYGEGDYFGTGATGSAQPFVLVALTVYFALVMWPGTENSGIDATSTNRRLG
jgi:hypothetical protein